MPRHIRFYLVVLQIPTLDLLVFSTGEQVGAAIADRHATHGADVPSQGQFQFSTGQVPDLSGQTDFRSYCEHFNRFSTCSFSKIHPDTAEQTLS